MRDFRELKVWEKSHQFVKDVYRIKSDFPKDEQFGLASQIKRAAASVPTNIAEGCGRYGEKELARFMGIAAGSASEAEYQLFLAHDLGYITANQYGKLNESVKEVKKMLHAFIKKLTDNS